MATAKTFLVGAECGVEVNNVGMVAKSENVRAEYTRVDPGAEGLIGTREPAKGRVIVLKNDVKGSLVVPASFYEASILIGVMFANGTSSATDATFSGYTAREIGSDPASNNTADILIDRKHATGKIFSYANVWPSRQVYRWSESNPCEIETDFLGQSEGTATDTVNAAGTQAPAISDDVTFSWDGTECYTTGGEITVDLQMDERFYSSLTRTHAQPKVLSVGGVVDVELNTDTWIMFLENGANANSHAIRYKVDNGTYGYGLYLPACCFHQATPTVEGPDIVKARLEFKAYLSTYTVVAFTK